MKKALAVLNSKGILLHAPYLIPKIAGITLRVTRHSPSIFLRTKGACAKAR